MLYVLGFWRVSVFDGTLGKYYVYDTDDLTLETWNGTAIYNCYNKGVSFGCSNDSASGMVMFFDCQAELSCIRTPDVVLVQTFHRTSWKDIEADISLWYNGFMYNINVKGSSVMGKLFVSTLNRKVVVDCKSANNLLALAVVDELKRGNLVYFVGNGGICKAGIGAGIRCERSVFNKKVALL